MASFSSHFILDTIPHYDYSIAINDFSTPYKLALDFLFTLTIFLFVFWLSVKKSNAFLQEPIDNRHKLWAQEGIRYLNFLGLVVLGIFFAWLPDIFKILTYNQSGNVVIEYINKFHVQIHSRHYLAASLGLILQIILSISCAIIAKGVATENELNQQVQILNEEFEEVFTTKN